jgi:hypothetical protein
MWIFAREGFCSIVQDMFDPSMLLVRSRIEGDLEKLFPDAEVVEAAGSDYRFRAYLPRETVAAAIGKMVLSVDYGNFKASVRDNRRSPFYARVWATMAELQDAVR